MSLGARAASAASRAPWVEEALGPLPQGFVPTSSWAEAINRSNAYGAQNNFAGQEYYLRNAVYLGGAEPRTVYVLAGKVRAQFGLRPNARAAAYALATAAREHIPGLWAELTVAESAADYADYDAARRALQRLVRAQEALDPEQRAAAQRLYGRLSTRTYRCVWRADFAQIVGRPANKPGNEVWVARPVTELPTQTVLGCRIDGAPEQREAVDDYGNQATVVTLGPEQDFSMTADIKLRPTSVRRRLDQVSQDPLPDGLDRYLGRTVGIQPSAVIDPTTERVRAIIDSQRGDSQTATIENIFEWCERHMVAEVELPSGPAWGSEQALAAGGGSCMERTTAVVVLLRALGVPARYLRGSTGLTTGRQGVMGPHYIPEFYLNGLGWIAWEYGEPPWAQPTNFVRRFRHRTPVEDFGPADMFLFDVPSLTGCLTFELIDETMEWPG